MRAFLRRLGIALAILVGVLALALAVVAVKWPTLFALVRYYRDPARLEVPVAGVRAPSLDDTWGAARSEGRHHEGIDIFARRGMPVVSATVGTVTRIGENRLGGHCVWVAGAGARIYYYAHLDRFEPARAVGDDVVPGDVLGYVGTSGNAQGTPPHLHFGVYPLANYFRAVDPFPLLRPGVDPRGKDPFPSLATHATHAPRR